MTDVLTSTNVVAGFKVLCEELQRHMRVENRVDGDILGKRSSQKIRMVVMLDDPRLLM